MDLTVLKPPPLLSLRGDILLLLTVFNIGVELLESFNGGAVFLFDVDGPKNFSNFLEPNSGFKKVKSSPSVILGLPSDALHGSKVNER